MEAEKVREEEERAENNGNAEESPDTPSAAPAREESSAPPTPAVAAASNQPSTPVMGSAASPTVSATTVAPVSSDTVPPLGAAAGTGEASADADGLMRTMGGSVRTCGSETCNATTGLRPCYDCMATYYCSVECQRRHWPVHVMECAKTRAGFDPEITIISKVHDPEVVPRLFEYWQSVLSRSQLDRVNAFRVVFKDYIKFSPTDLIRLIEGEVDPEREITGWERLAEAFQEVISSRPGKTGKLLRARIYGALHAMCAVGVEDIDRLKKASVHAKKLGAKRGQLEKVIDIWQAAGCLQPIAVWQVAGGKKKKKKKGKGKGKGKKF